ncbi:MAG: hypothetical protein KatS3mg105_1489 [Gemmatales bacterium]|nr:MAG: hypothetical protein KatS3mg105_1489 [Gemmatales bacterium]
MRTLVLTIGLVGCLSGVLAQEKRPGLLIVDGKGKEHAVQSWKFTAGVREMSWLAPPAKAKPATPKDGEAKRPVPRPTGPLAFEFREENSTNFVNGIVTLIPLAHLEELAFDDENQTVTAKVAGPADAEPIVLKGSTKYRGINKVAIEVEIPRGDMGIASVTFRGGVPNGIQRVKLLSAKPAAPVKPPAITLVAADENKSVHKVSDLKVLYRDSDGRWQLSSTLMFKKTLKVDLGKIKSLKISREQADRCEVIFADGEELSLTLLKTVTLDDQRLLLEGLLATVPAGYKLFPLHTVTTVQFNTE